MDNVITFEPADKRSMLRGLDQLRKDVESGEVTALMFIGVRPDDTTVFGWGAQGEGMSYLRGLGAIEALKHRFLQALPPLPEDGS